MNAGPVAKRARATVSFRDIESKTDMPERSKSAVEQLLRMTREMHSVARALLAPPKPNRAAAKRFMRSAIKAGKAAAPYIRDPLLRQRIVADVPMSEHDWQEVCEVLQTDPNRIYFFYG